MTDRSDLAKPILRRLAQRYPSGLTRSPMRSSCARCLETINPDDPCLFLAGEAAHPACNPMLMDNFKALVGKYEMDCGACGFKLHPGRPIVWRSRTYCRACVEAFEALRQTSRPGELAMPVPELPRTPFEMRVFLTEPSRTLSVFGKEQYGFATVLEDAQGKHLGAWKLKARDIVDAKNIALAVVEVAGKALPIVAPGTGGRMYGEGESLHNPRSHAVQCRCALCVNDDRFDDDSSDDFGEWDPNGMQD